MKQTKTDGRTVARLRGTASAWSSSASRFILSFGLAFLTPAATADVVGYFKFDDFPGDNANFTDDAGKGLRGLLGFPFSAPVSCQERRGNRAILPCLSMGKAGWQLMIQRPRY